LTNKVSFYSFRGIGEIAFPKFHSTIFLMEFSSISLLEKYEIKRAKNGKITNFIAMIVGLDFYECML